MFNKKGQSLIELLIIIGLSAFLMPPIFMGYMSSREGKAQQKKRLLATSLMKETQEETRNIREHGWDYLAPTGTYHPVLSGSTLSLVAGPTNINGFTQQVVVGDVYRNTSGTIVLSPTPGLLDPSTKKITTTISWTEPRISSINHATYMTRFRDNIPYTETTKAQFNNDPTHLSVFDKTTAVNTTGSTLPDDGEVDMGLGGLSDWCNPAQSVTTVNLSRQGIPTAISAIDGSVITGTGGNASGPTFAQTSFPSAQTTGTYDNNKANGVFRDNEHYGYIATTDHNAEVKILDLDQYSNPPVNDKFLNIGWFNAPGNGTTYGNSVYVLNNIGYLTTLDNKFYTFNLTEKTNQRSELGSYDLGGIGNKIVVSTRNNKTYAFVAMDSTTTQLQVIDVTHPEAPLKVAWYETGNSQPGIDIATNSSGTRAYLVTSYASGKKDFFILDTSAEALSGNLPLIGTFDTGGMTPKGVAIATGNRAIIVGTGGSYQYMVLKLDDETSPVSCPNIGLAIAGGAFGVSTVTQSSNGYAYAYIVTGDTNAELKIIEGGPGGSFGYNGVYTSAPFDTDGTFTHAFNRFFANVSVPSQTSIGLQVAVANAGANGCIDANYTFIGPDPADYLNSRFQPVGSVISGQIPLVTYQNYVNPGRCFKYKAYLNTPDSSRTPALFDMTVNYSP
ncbi:MAG: hypothetical protein WC741_04840 [Patescibacteria group bacterium]